MPPGESEAALRIRELSVDYRHDGRLVNVLNRLTFELKKGEIVSLLGESGSGKSTFAKALTGLLPPSAVVSDGRLTIGSDFAFNLSDGCMPWERLRGRQIGLLFQDAQQALNPVMKIKHHFRESLLFHRLASPEEVQDISVKLLRSLRFSDPLGVLERFPFQLSGGMCQRVCLALALCLKPAVLIADEPTSALDTVSQREVLELLAKMRRDLDLAVLLITHDVAVANAISDRVIVLNKGALEEEGETRLVLTKPAAAYTQRLLASRAQISGLPRHDEPLSEEPLLQIVGLEKTFNRNKRVLHKLDLTLHSQQIVGILGQSGCGKSTLARSIAGLETPSGGKIMFRGTDIGRLRGRRRRELCRRIQLVFQDARGSLNPGRTALQLVQEPLQYLRIGSRQDREMMAMFYLHEVGIEGEMLNRKPPQLSTGQCQRIAIARALVLQPDVLICDEAVSALDMSIQAQILALLHRLHRQHGFAIVMISHDIRVLRSLCHRIAVMKDGSFCEIRRTDEPLEESGEPYTQLLLRCAGELEAGL